MARRSTKRARFRPGDMVRFRYGLREINGQIVENCGPIGIGGRRLYAVRINPHAENMPVTSMHEDEMTFVQVASPGQSREVAAAVAEALRGDASDP